jgi:predicted hydrocarbon binding protein
MPPSSPAPPAEARHNYYTDEEFYCYDPSAGVVRNAYGQRVLRVTADFLPALRAALEQELGDAADEALYRVGYEWGRADMATFPDRASREYAVEFEKMAMGVMLETWWWPRRVGGWGHWRYDFRQARKGIVALDLFESAVAEADPDAGRPVCHLYAGLFTAVFSTLARRELAGVELQCRAAGAEHCTFLVSSPPRVSAATAWRNEGVIPSDVLRRLSAAV